MNREETRDAIYNICAMLGTTAPLVTLYENQCTVVFRTSKGFDRVVEVVRYDDTFSQIRDKLEAINGTPGPVVGVISKAKYKLVQEKFDIGVHGPVNEADQAQSMITSQKTWSTLESSSDERLSTAKLSYFRERLRNRVHEEVLKKFISESQDSGLTRSLLAKRLGKRPEQITRWLSAPGNWTIETISDLLLAMNAELEIEIAGWADRPFSNYAHDSICTASATFEELAKSSSIFSLDKETSKIEKKPRKASSASYHVKEKGKNDAPVRGRRMSAGSSATEDEAQRIAAAMGDDEEMLPDELSPDFEKYLKDCNDAARGEKEDPRREDATPTPETMERFRMELNDDNQLEAPVIKPLPKQPE